MKAVVVCVVALVFVAAAVSAVPTLKEKQFLFTSFLRQHQKHYSDVAEFNRRFQIFSQNLDFIHSHNEEAAQGKHSYTLGMNKFGDITNEEYRALLKTRGTRHSNAHSVFRPTYQALPDTVDWRTKGVISPVKDQGQCGSCWSFSATGSMEGAHALATGKLVSFSEQELVDCVNGGADTCDLGGEMQDGFTYAIQNGIEGESDYPYCACSGNSCKFDKSKVRATFSSYQNVTSGSESDLQAAVAQQPGVSIAIDASSMNFQFYSGGVFDYSGCKNKVEDLDHGVLAVGYGTYNGKAYWLVKNSWSASWGLQGYIMMSRNKNNQCGVATDASFILV